MLKGNRLGTSGSVPAYFVARVPTFSHKGDNPGCAGKEKGSFGDGCLANGAEGNNACLLVRMPERAAHCMSRSNVEYEPNTTPMLLSYTECSTYVSERKCTTVRC